MTMTVTPYIITVFQYFDTHALVGGSGGGMAVAVHLALLRFWRTCRLLCHSGLYVMLLVRHFIEELKG